MLAGSSNEVVGRPATIVADQIKTIQCWTGLNLSSKVNTKSAGDFNH